MAAQTGDRDRLMESLDTMSAKTIASMQPDRAARNLAYPYAQAGRICGLPELVSTSAQYLETPVEGDGPPIFRWSNLMTRGLVACEMNDKSMAQEVMEYLGPHSGRLPPRPISGDR